MNNKLEKERKQTLARAQGDTYTLALDEMKDEDVSASREVEDYIISIACENAEGMYMDHNGQLEWMTPSEKENQHVEVVVQDKLDKRFIPNLTVFAKLFDSNKKEIVKLEVPFIWHPFLFHYGINTTIPKEDDYTIEVMVKKPSFHRHDEEVGRRYQNDVIIMLGLVHLKPGRKPHGPE